MQVIDNPMYTVLEFAPELGPSGSIKQIPERELRAFCLEYLQEHLKQDVSMSQHLPLSTLIKIVEAEGQKLGMRGERCVLQIIRSDMMFV